jgi:hypothetical protein
MTGRRLCGAVAWEPDDADTGSIAAGTPAPPTGLRVSGSWYPNSAGDYGELPEDAPTRG